MEIEIRCPACRARQTLGNDFPADITCRRCDADLLLLSGVVVKVKRLRAELAAMRAMDSPPTEVLKRLGDELKLWDPAGRIE